jgi:hypothetical protein
MAKDPNESNCIEKIIYKCQWRHWLLLLVGESVATLALGSRPKQGLARVQANRRSMGVASHAPKSVGECEGMNTHTPKWAPILGVGVRADSWIFKKKLHGSKPIGL